MKYSVDTLNFTEGKSTGGKFSQSKIEKIQQDEIKEYRSPKKMSRRELQQIIVFSKPDDPRTGFLSNESKHSFVLEEKRWPTVEHYLQAKKFDGTEHEEMIRNAPTVYQAKRFARSRQVMVVDDSGRISKGQVCGRGHSKVNYHIREDWITVEPRLMEDAVRAKFTQNLHLRRKLIATHKARLLCSEQPLVGKTLEKIRGDLSSKSTVLVEESKERFGWDEKNIKDLSSGHLSPKDRKFVEGVISLSLRIAAEEGWDKVHPEMVEDAAHMISPGTSLVKYIHGLHEISWTVIYQKLPNYENIVNEVHEIFVKSDPSQSTQISSSALIAAMVRWLHLEASVEQQKKIYSQAQNEKTLEITLPKEKRWYRKSPPCPPKHTPSKPKRSRSLTPKEKKVVRDVLKKNRSMNLKELHGVLKERFGDGDPVMRKRSLKEYVINHRRSPRPTAPLAITDVTKDSFFVRGKNLPKYSSRLLSLGGKYPQQKDGRGRADTTRIKFPKRYLERIERIILDTLPSTERYSKMYQRWTEERLFDFIDTSIQIAYLSGEEKIDESTIKIVVQQIYGYQTPKNKSKIELDHTDSIDTILSKRSEYVKYTFTTASKKILSKYVESIGNILTSSIEEPTCENLLRCIQEEEERIEKMGDCPNIEKIPSRDVCIIRALRHVAACFKNIIGYPAGEELAIHAFLTLLPPRGWRVGADQYISTSLREEIDPDSISTVRKIVQYYDRESKDIGSTSGVLGTTEEMINVFALSLNYLTVNLQRSGQEYVTRRVKMLGYISEPRPLPERKVPNYKEIILIKPEGVTEVDSTLTTFEYADFVVVITNSSSTSLPKSPTPSEKITNDVFHTYPYANIYAAKPKKTYQSGSVIINRPVERHTKNLISSTTEHRHVICLVAEFAEGNPKKIVDSVSDRRGWFENGLKELFSHPSISNHSLAFSSLQLEPSEYHDLVLKYAEGHTGNIYILTEKTSRRDPTIKSKEARARRKLIIKEKVSVD